MDLLSAIRSHNSNLFVERKRINWLEPLNPRKMKKKVQINISYSFFFTLEVLQQINVYLSRAPEKYFFITSVGQQANIIACWHENNFNFSTRVNICSFAVQRVMRDLSEQVNMI